MKNSQTLWLLSSLSIFYTPVSSYWRAACSVVQTSRADPILSPGTVSGHVHKFAGASNVNPSSDYNSLQSSECSSCEIQADKSAYWTPQLYYAHSNGTVQSVPNEGMTVYYVGRGGNASSTQPFPPGFKMLTGNSLVRSYDNETLTYLNTRPVADRVSFHCIDENNDIPEQHYMFDTNCVNGMRAQVNFQSCWDGVNLYLPLNAHVDYLSGIDYGVCPPSHPVSIPGLFFEVLYWTNDIDQSAGGQFVFANGDTTGYGFHGDFLNGWDMDVQTAAVADCLYLDDGGVVSACPALAPTDDINFPRDCLPQPPLNDEPVLGFLTQLPGCNPITSGPEPAPQVICALDSNTPISGNSTSAATSTFVLSTASSTSTTISISTSTSTSTSISNSTSTLTSSSALSFSVLTTPGFLTFSTSISSIPDSPTSTSTSTGFFESPTTDFFASPTTNFSPFTTNSPAAISFTTFTQAFSTFAFTSSNEAFTTATVTNTVAPAVSFITTLVTLTEGFSLTSSDAAITESPQIFVIVSTISTETLTGTTAAAAAPSDNNAATTLQTVTVPSFISSPSFSTETATFTAPTFDTTFFRRRRRNAAPLTLLY